MGYKLFYRAVIQPGWLKIALLNVKKFDLIWSTGVGNPATPTGLLFMLNQVDKQPISVTNGCLMPSISC